MTRRVVITGLGAVSPFGVGVTVLWQGLLEGKSGISTIEQFDTSAFKVRFGGEVKHFAADKLLDAKAARRLDRFAQFALVASKEAIKDSGFEVAREDPFRCGVIFGSGIGGIGEFEEQHARYIAMAPAVSRPSSSPR